VRRGEGRVRRGEGRVRRGEGRVRRGEGRVHVHQIHLTGIQKQSNLQRG
jgi:hypothetical protein